MAAGESYHPYWEVGRTSISSSSRRQPVEFELHTHLVSDVLLRSTGLFAVIAGSWAVGIALCLMKGDTGGLLNTLGNLSAPYGITAIVAGLTTRRYWSGALLGIAATEATLGGFYWAYATLLGHEVSTSTLSIWCGLGLALGAACGLIGRAGVGRPALWYAIPALLLFEPLALRVEVITSQFGFGYADLSPEDLLAFAIEITIGVAALLLVRTRVLHARGRQS